MSTCDNVPSVLTLGRLRFYVTWAERRFLDQTGFLLPGSLTVSILLKRFSRPILQLRLCGAVAGGGLTSWRADLVDLRLSKQRVSVEVIYGGLLLLLFIVSPPSAAAENV